MGYEFALRVLEINVWPIVVLFVLIILRRPLSRLVPFLHHIRYKDFEVNFSNNLSEARLEAERVLPQQKVTDQSVEIQDQLQKLAKLSPRAAIIEAWLEVEGSASGLIQKADMESSLPRAISPLGLGYKLHHAGRISKAQLDIYHRLRNLRNVAVHFADLQLKEEEVKQFIRLAIRLAASLRQMPHAS